MRRKNNKISYIKKPFARRSFFCLPLSAAALVFGIVSLFLSVRMQGNGEINVAAWGLSSILFAVAGLGYGVTSFLEKEMNYILSKIWHRDQRGAAGVLGLHDYCGAVYLTGICRDGRRYRKGMII